MDTTTVITFLALWAFVGLTTGIAMIRRGHDHLWLLLALALGPLLVPIALERVQCHPRLISSGSDGAAEAKEPAPDGLRVLVGLDGSPDSDRALATALKVLGPRCQLVMLAEVVNNDEIEDRSHTALDAARARLVSATATAREAGVPARFEVLAGPIGETLRQFADEQSMDVLVVGRRGRGRSTRLLGSVSAYLVQHSPVPLLILEPTLAGQRHAGR